MGISRRYGVEDPNKILDYQDLVEAIIESIHYVHEHDSEYLGLRIQLLREALGLDLGSNENSKERVKLLEQICSESRVLETHALSIFDGVVEADFNRPEFQAFAEVQKSLQDEINQVAASLESINMIFIANLLEGALKAEGLGRTVTVKELTASGLPINEPFTDQHDW
ncbi:MAG: hypothetical protein WA090_04790 [Candidatus Nanopelagicaceae bacterium]